MASGALGAAYTRLEVQSDFQFLIGFYAWSWQRSNNTRLYTVVLWNSFFTPRLYSTTHTVAYIEVYCNVSVCCWGVYDILFAHGVGLDYSTY